MFTKLFFQSVLCGDHFCTVYVKHPKITFPYAGTSCYVQVQKMLSTNLDQFQLVVCALMLIACWAVENGREEQE